MRVFECVCVCTDARVGGLSGRRGGWEEEEAFDFGRRGFLGRRVGRVGLEMSPSFPSSPMHKTDTQIIQPKGNAQTHQTCVRMQRDLNTCMVKRGELQQQQRTNLDL